MHQRQLPVPGAYRQGLQLPQGQQPAGMAAGGALCQRRLKALILQLEACQLRQP